LDELWTFVRKRLSRLAEGETGEDETLWAWIAFAAEQRLILALVVAPRAQAGADELIARTASVLAGSLPLFVSEDLDQCGVVLLDRWHIEVPRSPTGRPGPRVTR
jgi:hypothetical protein